MIRAGIRRAFRLPLRGRHRWERDVEDEIKLHLTLRAEQLMAAGVSPEHAYDEAVRRFGALTESRARLVDAARHREASMQRAEYWQDLRQDLAFAFRTLARQKGWTAITLITLALGIGATTAVFSAVSSLLLHPLPYPNANRVVFIDQQPSEGNKSGISVSILPSALVVRAWRERAHSFEALEGYNTTDLSLRTKSGEPSTITSIRVFPSFLSFAGQRPLFGRMFDSTDVARGGHVLLLSEAFWRERFGADHGVVGNAIALDDTLYTVIGVMPASLKSPSVGDAGRDVWMPLDIRNNDIGMRLIGRLRPGASVAVAARELDSASAAVDGSGAKRLPFIARVVTPAQTVSFRDSLVMLTGAVALVMLVACANVAHLLMARAAVRERELAVRIALGAGRGRLFRQLLTESLVLTSVGALLGFGIGWAGLKVIIALRPRALSALDAAHLDVTTGLIAVGLAVVSAVAFGVLGALQSARRSTHGALKTGGSGSSASRMHARGRATLVVSEMALSATLVVGATMLVRSVINLQRADLGFDPHGLYHIELVLPRARFADAAARTVFLDEFASRLRSASGIKSISVDMTPPGWRNFSIGRFEIQGEPVRTGTTEFIDINSIDGDYFKTMGMRLTQGTMFTDTSKAAGQAIINAGFARAHWPGGSAIGHRVRVAQSGDEPWLTIVGVANEAQTSGPGSESSTPLLYWPSRPEGRRSIIVRTSGDAQLLTHAKTLARSMDAQASANVTSVERDLAQAISGPRFVMLILAVFTGLALVLAAVGMYGVMAYTVAQKTREIGIRVALGAPRQRIAASILVRGAVLALVGSTLGMASATWGTRLIEHQLYGVARSDIASFAAAIVVLAATAALACIVPTRRALAVDPMTAIRAE